MTRRARKPVERAQMPELLTAAEAARFLRLSFHTLSHYRCQGRGPIYRKHGWRIYYAVPDLIAWSNEQTWSSTSVLLSRQR